jgi:hypothetical protein
LNRILNASLSEAEAVYRQLYEHQASLIRFLSDLGIPLPRSLETAAEFSLNTSLRRAIEADEIDLGRITALLEEARALGIPLDAVSLGYALKKKIEGVTEQFRAHPVEISLLRTLEAVIGLACSMPFEVDFWKAQNIYFEVQRKVYPDFVARAERSEESARVWVSHFASLGEKLYC